MRTRVYGLGVALVLTVSLSGPASGLSVPVAGPSLSASSPRFPSCVTEDGAGPCVWDAMHRGNGMGHSFIRGSAGNVRFISHTRAHRIIYGN